MPSSSTTASNDDTAPIDFLRAPLKETQALAGGWLQLVKAHHLMIEQAFDALIDDSGRNFSRCAVLHKRLGAGNGLGNRDRGGTRREDNRVCFSATAESGSGVPPL